MKNFIKAFVILIIAFAIINSCSGKNNNKDKAVNDPVTIEDKSSSNTKKMDQNDSNSNTPTEDKAAEASIPLDKQKEYYTEFTKPEIDSVIDEFDLVWDSLWIKTFTEISDGSMDIYEGYEKLDTAEKRYDRLYDRLNKVPDKGLEKDRKKQIGSFSVEVQDSIGLRIEVIKKAKKMFDTGKIIPSTLAEIKQIIEGSDEYMQQAILILTSIDKELSIEQ
ncbi:hypothetical protein EI981_13175 [Paenibacillus lutimineralis]|uniref:Uncharacterized protein n=1 Tax=Paenibacillus lutimineralis TaxID=2707005 RepID=A0A3S9UYA7_9BACL|nr:hypothetical protein EI981_13175 [Paenibacillus lutimineralis]